MTRPRVPVAQSLPKLCRTVGNEEGLDEERTGTRFNELQHPTDIVLHADFSVSSSK